MLYMYIGFQSMERPVNYFLAHFMICGREGNEFRRIIEGPQGTLGKI